MHPVRLACILAAGLGSRLGGLAGGLPKGFLRLGDRPIVEESLDRLEAAGVERVVVVTGHRPEPYRELAARRGLTCVHNDRYADSGSLYSLWLARGKLEEDLLLLESDLVYEPRALEACLGAGPDAVLLSGPTGSGDEVWVEAPGGLLAAMSKRRSRLGEVAGELVGISRISRRLFAAVTEAAEERFRHGLRVDYEEGLTAAAARVTVRCPVVEDLLWAEIDDEAHLERARRVYAALGDQGRSGPSPGRRAG